MAIGTVKVDGRGNKQITIDGTTTGAVWFDCNPAQHFRFAVNTGHGATYDVQIQLTRASGDVTTPATFIDSSGNTDGVNVSGRPGIERIGINITANAGGGDVVVELSQAKG